MLLVVMIMIISSTVRAELVAGVWAVFVSCPLLTRQILASEGRYPVHLVPQAWTVFNRRHHRKRGLTTQGTTAAHLTLLYRQVCSSWTGRSGGQPDGNSTLSF